MWEMLKKEGLISCMKRSLKSCNGWGFLAPSYTNFSEGLGLPACLTRGLGHLHTRLRFLWQQMRVMTRDSRRTPQIPAKGAQMKILQSKSNPLFSTEAPGLGRQVSGRGDRDVPAVGTGVRGRGTGVVGFPGRKTGRRGLKYTTELPVTEQK